MDYTPIKKAMRAIGHEVSEGAEWLVSDHAEFRSFAYFTLGILPHTAHAIFQFPEHFAEAWQKIRALGGDVAASAPIGEQDAQTAPAESTVVEAPAPTSAEPVADTAPVEPVVDTPAEEPEAKEASDENEEQETASEDQKPEAAESATQSMSITGEQE